MTPQAALMTLPDLRHRVQTLIRFVLPFTTARTVWRFGSNRRGVTLWAWLMFLPTTGPLPQISQRMAMTDVSCLLWGVSLKPKPQL
jgi:hypothetical protein